MPNPKTFFNGSVVGALVATLLLYILVPRKRIEIENNIRKIKAKKGAKITVDMTNDVKGKVKLPLKERIRSRRAARKERRKK